MNLRSITYQELVNESNAVKAELAKVQKRIAKARKSAQHAVKTAA